MEEQKQEIRESEDGLFEHHRLEIDQGQKPMRVDVWLTTMIRNATRTKIKNAALAGGIKVNDKSVKASYKVKPGDVVTYLKPYAPQTDLIPEDIPLNIVHEDEDVILINKQPGMVCHPGLGHYSGTLVHALLYHCEQLPVKDPKNEDDQLRPGLVHRLDKDTSGLIIVAKNEFSGAHLSNQFFEHTTDRNYLAIVWGDVEADNGTVTGYIGRSARDRKKFINYKDESKGKWAVTHYEVLERFGFATLIRCKLETGRTHQIRVQLKSIGHTLFSDSFYGGDKVLAGLQTSKFNAFIRNCISILPRQALHAKTLGFTHPRTGERLHFESETPPEFLQVMDRFRVYNKGKTG